MSTTQTACKGKNKTDKNRRGEERGFCQLATLKYLTLALCGQMITLEATKNMIVAVGTTVYRYTCFGRGWMDLCLFSVFKPQSCPLSLGSSSYFQIVAAGGRLDPPRVVSILAVRCVPIVNAWNMPLCWCVSADSNNSEPVCLGGTTTEGVRVRRPLGEVDTKKCPDNAQHVV